MDINDAIIILRARMKSLIRKIDAPEREALQTAISVMEKSRWIPCSERLPEKPNVYTVTDSKGDVVRFVFYNNESSREYWLRCAKAWMPLPEPYNGDNNG